MAGTDDFVAGMTGLIGSTVLIGVGAAAGSAVIRQIDRMGEQPKQQRKRKRKGNSLF